jgi:hypothetical protein
MGGSEAGGMHRAQGQRAVFERTIAPADQRRCPDNHPSRRHWLCRYCDAYPIGVESVRRDEFCRASLRFNAPYFPTDLVHSPGEVPAMFGRMTRHGTYDVHFVRRPAAD